MAGNERGALQSIASDVKLKQEYKKRNARRNTSVAAWPATREKEQQAPCRTFYEMKATKDAMRAMQNKVIRYDNGGDKMIQQRILMKKYER